VKAISRDIDRYLRGTAGGRRACLLAIATSCGLQAVLVYRFGRFLLRLQREHWWAFPLLVPAWIVYAVGAFVVRVGYGIHLSLSADIGPGLCVWHFGGIDVRDCRIGANCAIAQQTRIGRDHAGAETRGPTIGDRVWLSPHVRIVGPFTIGPGATIGAGVTISEDVPARVLVIGNPARVTLQDYDNSLFNF
jgi:serine O-acetyltransferase